MNYVDPKNYKLEDDIDIIMNPPPRSGYEGAVVLDPSRVFI